MPVWQLYEYNIIGWLTVLRVQHQHLTDSFTSASSISDWQKLLYKFNMTAQLTVVKVQTHCLTDTCRCTTSLPDWQLQEYHITVWLTVALVPQDCLTDSYRSTKSLPDWQLYNITIWLILIQCDGLEVVNMYYRNNIIVWLTVIWVS